MLSSRMVEVRTRYIQPVMFTCEVKGEPVSTGHRMRVNEFAAIVGPRSFRCGSCGEIHTWTTKTAWLGEGPPPSFAPARAEAASETQSV